MSHRHHNSPPPPPDSQPEPTPTNKYGLESAMDPTVLEEMLLVVVVHSDTQDYISVLMEMLEKSKVYAAYRKSNSKTRDEFIAEGRSVEEATAMEQLNLFAVAFLTGASCMLRAVDEGYVPDSEDEDGDEEGEEL